MRPDARVFPLVLLAGGRRHIVTMQHPLRATPVVWHSQVVHVPSVSSGRRAAIGLATLCRHYRYSEEPVDQTRGVPTRVVASRNGTRLSEARRLETEASWKRLAAADVFSRRRCLLISTRTGLSITARLGRHVRHFHRVPCANAIRHGASLEDRGPWKRLRHLCL